jgi:hypothetical protein
MHMRMHPRAASIVYSSFHLKRAIMVDLAEPRRLID